MIKKFFNNTSSLFAQQQTSILSASSIIMATVITSRLLGLLRDRLLTGRFTVDELGLYFAAFRLPNMIFELIVMGALSTAFIPVFTSYLTKKGKKQAFRLAASVINIGLIIYALIAVVILLFTPSLVAMLAPGYSASQLRLVSFFTRVMIVAQVFPLIIGNFFTGILQSFKRFIIPALAPVIYNIGTIIGILTLTSSLGLLAPVIGVVLGAVLFTLIQVPLVFKIGYRHLFIFCINDKGVRKIGKLMFPRTLGLAVSQIDATVDLILASLLGARSVSIFNLAQHLQYVPVGLFGASISQAALPTLSELYASKKLEDFKQIFLTTFHQILFLTLPASVILIVLRIPVVRLVFGASRFDWTATVLTGKTVAFFALSLFAQAQIHLLVRTFYALHNSRTPVLIGAIAVAINTILSIVFIRFFHLPVWGLSLSTSISALLNAFLLFILLDRAINGFDKIKLLVPAVKMFFASAITAVALYIPMKLLDQLVFDTTRTLELLLLTGIASSVGLFVYFFLAWFLNISEVSLFFKLAAKIRKTKQTTIMETSREIVNSEASTI